MIKKIIFVFLVVLFNASASSALIQVDITRGNLNPLPIAVSPLSSETKTQNDLKKDLKINNLGEEISKVIENNLKNTGLFNPLNKNAFLPIRSDICEPLSGIKYSEKYI